MSNVLEAPWLKITSAVINLLVQIALNLIIYCSSDVCLTLYGVYFLK